MGRADRVPARLVPLSPARALADPAAELPLPAELLGLCDRGAGKPWRSGRVVARRAAHRALPPLGRQRLRPGSPGGAGGAPTGSRLRRSPSRSRVVARGKDNTAIR